MFGRKILITFFLVFESFFARDIFAQKLNEQWKNINEKYKQRDYVTLTLILPDFIDSLKYYHLNSKLVLPYLFLAESQAYLENFNQADSNFKHAKEIADKLNLAAERKIVIKHQLDVYANIIENTEAKDPNKTLLLLNRFIELATGVKQNYEAAWAFYKKARLESRFGKADETLLALERALPYAIAAMPKSSRLTTNIKAKLFDIYLSRNESDKAYLLVDTSNVQQMRAVIFRYAKKLSSNGEFKEADKILRTLQNNILSSGSNKLIESYSKERLFYYKNLNSINDGIDSVKSIIESLRKMGKLNPALEFNLNKIIILADIEGGYLNDAASLISSLDSDIVKSKYPAEFNSQLKFLKGDLAYLKGDNKNAIKYYLEVSANKSLSPNESLILLNNLGLAYYHLNQFKKSLLAFRQIQKVKYDSTNARIIVNSYINSGILLIKQDELQKSVDDLTTALNLTKKYSLKKLNVFAKLHLAECYYLMGYSKLSGEIFDEVVKYSSQSFEPLAKVEILKLIAEYEKEHGEYGKALSSLRGALRLANNMGFYNAAYSIAEEIADVDMIVGKYSNAVNFYLRLRNFINRTKKDKIYYNLKIAQCYSNLNKFKLALAYTDTASILLGEKPSEGSNIEFKNANFVHLYSITHALKSYVLFAKGINSNNLDEIIKAYNLSKRVIEFTKNYFYSDLIQSQEKENIWAKNVNVYNTFIDISYELYSRTGNAQYLEDAFNAAEELRAQNFVEEVGSQLIVKMRNKDVNEIKHLVKPVKKGLPVELNENIFNSRETLLASRGIKIVREEKDFTKIQKNYNKALEKLKNQKSKAVNLFSINTLNLNAARDFLHDDQMLVSYYANSNYTYIFTLTTDSSKIYRLTFPAKSLFTLVVNFRNQIQNLQNGYKETAEELYNILIAPFEEEIKNKILFIVPSGQLHNLPFNALYHKGKYLIETNELVTLPNVSALQFVFRKNNSNNLSASSILAIGNPLNPSVPPLPGAENEVKNIANIYPDTKLLVENNATESLIKADLHNYDVIHFACHGLFDPDFPLLSSLVLAPDSLNDGKLQLNEIYDLNLTNTSLVVMSACETALSKLNKNDDMIGLVRGFLYAGVPSIVASLWKVNDIATDKLMSLFYYYLRQGLVKANALREAEVEMIHNKQFSHPFYWAAFILSGMDR